MHVEELHVSYIKISVKLSSSSKMTFKLIQPKLPKFAIQNKALEITHSTYCKYILYILNLYNIPLCTHFFP